MHHGSWFRYISYDESKGRATIDRHLLQRVFAYARPYIRPVLMVLIAIVTTSLLELIPPLLYRDLIDNVLPNRDMTRLNWLAVGMLGIPILVAIIGVVRRHYSATAGEGIIYDLRQEMYEHLQQMSLRFFTDTKSGEIVSRFNSDVVGAQNAITGTLPNIITNIVTLFSTLAVMISIEWRLAVLAVVVFPLFLLPVKRVATILRVLRRQGMESNAEMSSIVNETLTINGAMLVKTFGRQPYEQGRFSNANRDVRDIGIRRARVSQMFFVSMGIATTIGTALIYWSGGFLVLQEAISVGTIVAFAAYLGRLYGPISALTNVQVEFATSMVSFERVFDYLDMHLEIDTPDQAHVLDQVAGHVDFKEVSFNYAGGKAPALPDRDENAALVGPSGAGKTTVTYLLPRLYDPTHGTIMLDGHDLREVDLVSLANQIGIVPQETYLFHDTILANLLYAKLDASQSDIEDACRAANIHDFIASLPDGYETVVGERGYRLSGGEKQRIAIARVILKDPRVLVLDEATAHLDSHSEALIQAALVPLFEGRTSLVIAHRLSTILAADKILVLDQGRLVETGVHEELLARGGLYAHLYETQYRDGERG